MLSSLNPILFTKPDKFLINKITSESELSGLFNFALKGLKRLIKDQQFSYFKESHEIKTEMQLSGSATANFVHDCLGESTGDFISKDDMYEAFVKYVRQNNLPVNSKEYLKLIILHMKKNGCLII